jgi:hypothetical protein
MHTGRGASVVMYPRAVAGHVGAARIRPRAGLITALAGLAMNCGVLITASIVSVRR